MQLNCKNKLGLQTWKPSIWHYCQYNRTIVCTDYYFHTSSDYF